MKQKVLITGASGQLGQCLAQASLQCPEMEWVFATREDLNLSDKENLKAYFQQNAFTHCINTAAYTNVEKAESEPESAFAINAEAVRNLAEICKENDVVLLHISTDYVFDGTKSTPYTENDNPNPINVYGKSKLEGEHQIQQIWDKHYIFRTSWLYSQYGHNFYKSILRMAEEGKPMTITSEQVGTPTNANDLAKAIVAVIREENDAYGLYHFSNAGETTWYGFAKTILEMTSRLETSDLVGTKHYATFAARPAYSVMAGDKIKNKLNINTLSWQESLFNLITTTTNF